MRYSEKKFELLKKMSNDKGIIAALAIDQRGSMRKMVKGFSDKERDQKIVSFKKEVSKQLTPYASSILLDPIYGGEAIKAKDQNCGLLMAYEVTGYRDEKRLPELLSHYSVLRLKELGADAIKVLLYYDVDDKANNCEKSAFIERIGSECEAEGLPFFLEIISYDKNIEDSKSKEFAKVKPYKVNSAIKHFSKERYKVDVLKVEVPVNMEYVEGFGEEIVYTREEAKDHFKNQSDNCDIPFIFLSAGVSNALFLETLKFAKEAGSQFNGVLCGRATWRDGVEEFIEDEERGRKWLESEGVDNIQKLNKVLEETAVSWIK